MRQGLKRFDGETVRDSDGDGSGEYPPDYRIRVVAEFDELGHDLALVPVGPGRSPRYYSAEEWRKAWKKGDYYKPNGETNGGTNE